MEAAGEAKRREEAEMAAHMGWSSRPSTKRLRISIDVRSGTSTRYSEVEVRDGESVTINLKASLVEGGEELFHQGRRVGTREGREALRLEEGRLQQYQPEGPGPERAQRASPPTEAEVQAYTRAWKEGSIDFDGLQSMLGDDKAMEIVRKVEQEGLRETVLPDVDTTNRKRWQQGQPVEELLGLQACRAEYHRWCTGEISSRDLVDKWGGDVLRVFQAWFMQGKDRDEVEGTMADSDHGGTGAECPGDEETLPTDIMQTALVDGASGGNELTDPEDTLSLPGRRHESRIT